LALNLDKRKQSVVFIVEVLRDGLPARFGKGLAAIVPVSSSVAITKYKPAGQPLPMLSPNRTVACNSPKRAEIWSAAAMVAHQQVSKILDQIDAAARTVIHGETTSVIPRRP